MRSLTALISNVKLKPSSDGGWAGHAWRDGYTQAAKGTWLHEELNRQVPDIRLSLDSAAVYIVLFSM